MRKAYIILAHKNPAQLSRLIKSLDDNQSTFFIHVDKKADASQFRNIAIQSNKIAFVQSVSTSWGSFGLVQATINGLRAIDSHPIHFDFISLISGQHYPIKSNNYINDFLNTTQHTIFLEYTNIPNYKRWRVRGGLYRIDKYFLGLQYYQRMTAKALNFLSSGFSFVKRKFPSDMKPYAGSQWWTMDNYAMQYLLRFIKNNKAYNNYHKFTFAPDELFFHNILLNSSDPVIQGGITNNNLLYINWPNLDHGHPEILKSADIGQIITSDALFARKFDLEQDARVLDLIDDSRTGSRVLQLSGDTVFNG